MFALGVDINNYSAKLGHVASACFCCVLFLRLLSQYSFYVQSMEGYVPNGSAIASHTWAKSVHSDP